MRIQKQIAPTVALVVGMLSLYLVSWHFYFRDWRASPDPFAPENDSLLSRTVRSVFAPIRQIEDVRERRAIGAAGKIAMQGIWEGPVLVDRRPVELGVRVSSSNILFEKAPHWPQLEGKTFPIQEDDGEWIPYFTTDLGRIYIQTPSELTDYGGSPDEMFLRTTGFLDPSEEDLKIFRKKK
jgi:hypothetical protein